MNDCTFDMSNMSYDEIPHYLFKDDKNGHG